MATGTSTVQPLCGAPARIVLTLAAILAGAGPGLSPASGASNEPRPDPAAARCLDRHCVACHDAVTAKGRLDLTALKADFADPAAAARWTVVLRRVEDGEMPPKNKPKPAAADRAAFLKWVESGLAGAERDRLRTLVRRLNLIEYENTVRDLLGVDLPLAEMLPEDLSAHGFDTVASAQEMSAAQAERYLELAGLALDAAFAPSPAPAKPTTQRIRFEPRFETVGKDKRKYTLDKVLPDGAVLAGFAGHTVWRATAAGEYKVRFSGRSEGGGGKPTGVTFSVTGAGREARFVGIYDLGPKSRIIEFTTRFPQGSRLAVGAYDLPYPNKPSQKLLDAYKGPRPAYEWVEFEGPFVRSHDQVLTASFGGTDPRKVAADGVEPALRAFLARAYRRPVGDEDLRPVMNLAKARMKSGARPPEALKFALQAVLVSPKFLYLCERPGPLDAHAVAARLSYFLWSSTPDEALARAAADGSLQAGDGLRRQVERMLADPRAEAFTGNFLGQWLGLRQIDATTPDNFLYPEFDKLLETSMVRETTLFFREVLDKDLSVATFIDSDFTFLNRRLAEVYGIPGVDGYEFRKVALRPEHRRGGVLTQGAILKVSANGTSTSPVVRGVWVLEHFLNRPAPPPPPDVPAVEPDIRGAKTIREQLAKHRTNQACAGCHARIDPYGVALESYDVIGGHRDNYRAVDDKVLAQAKSYQLSRFRPKLYRTGPKVEPDDVLPDGRTFANAAEFKKHLLADTEGFARGLTEKLVTYAIGHHPGVADRPAVERIETAELRLLRDFLARLKASKEAGGALLDRTMVLFGSSLGDANNHRSDNMPFLLFGGGFRHGRHLAFDNARNEAAPKIFVSMLQRLGVETDAFAGTRGTLPGLETTGA